ncbi:MAG: hypothetical protein FWH37_00490 [Candidatus Bathyarchaeota archaeon]|nr:hypothetical protein [Candidatus Termiticorpusculum sp.]
MYIVKSTMEELNISTLCSKCPFFQIAPIIKRKNARKRCRIEPQRQLRIYKCHDYESYKQQKKNLL